MLDYDPYKLYQLKRNDPLLQGYRRVIDSCEKRIREVRNVLNEKNRIDRENVLFSEDEDLPSLLRDDHGELTNTLLVAHVKECERKLKAVSSLLVIRSNELQGLMFERRRRIIRCLILGARDDVPSIPGEHIGELSPQQQLLFISYYLTKGLVYYGIDLDVIIVDVKTHYLANTIDWLSLTTVALQSICLLYHGSFLSHVVFYPGDIPIKVCDTITRFDDLMSDRDLGTDRIDDLHGYTIRERRWNFFPIFKFMVHHRMITREDLDHLKRDENEGTFQGGGEIGEYLALLDGYVPPDDVE